MRFHITNPGDSRDICASLDEIDSILADAKPIKLYVVKAIRDNSERGDLDEATIQEVRQRIINRNLSNEF